MLGGGQQRVRGSGGEDGDASAWAAVDLSARCASTGGRNVPNACERPSRRKRRVVAVQRKAPVPSAAPCPQPMLLGAALASSPVLRSQRDLFQVAS